MIDRAVELNLSKPIALADAGRIYTLCAVSDTALDNTGKAQYFAKSEGFYKRANTVSPNNDYIFGSWATAHYWRGEYAKAWRRWLWSAALAVPHQANTSICSARKCQSLRPSDPA